MTASYQPSVSNIISRHRHPLPRLCLFTDSKQPSGMGEHMLALAAELRGKYHIAFICPPSEGGDRFLQRATQLAVEVLPLAAAYDEPRGCDALRRWLISWGADIFHGHAGIGWEGFGGIEAARAATVPIILRTEHLPYLLDNRQQREDHRRSLAAVDRLICVSQAARQSYVDAGYPKTKISVVYNGISLPQVGAGRSLVRQRLGLPDNAALVLTVGRLEAQKGHHQLLDAVPDVLAKLPNTHFFWAGDGPLHEELQARINAIGVAARVHLLGRRADVPDLMNAANVFVLPSQFEGFPLSVLEAMAMCLPVVGTDVCGTAEAVVDGITGRLVPPQNSAALATAICEVLTHPELATSWGAAGHQRVQQHFTAAHMAAATSKIYEELLVANGLHVATSISNNLQSSVLPLSYNLLSTFREMGATILAEQIRVGFIGAGGIASRHVADLLGFADTRIAAFADPATARAGEQAARCGANVYADYTQMLESEALDALYICVPPFAHGGPELAAVERNIPFFVEKPLALEWATAERINAAVTQQGLTTAVGYHWRYLDTTAQAQELLAKYPARLALGYWLDATPPPAWWRHEAESGGQMVEQTTHIFDLARLLVGEVTQVYAAGNTTPRATFPDLDVYDVSVATLHFASGALGNMASTCLLNWPHRIGLHLFSEGMAIEMTEFEIMIDVGQGRPVQRAEGDPFVREDRDFIDAVQGKANRIRTPYAEAMKTHRLTTAAAQSAREGQPLTILH